MRAASGGTAAGVKLLLAAHANVFLLDRSGKSALYRASSVGRDCIAQILFQATNFTIIQEWQGGPVELCNLIADYC